MEILGRDIYEESYRVALDVGGARVLAHVPERFFATQTGARPSHETAYEGLARDRNRIETAITQLARGQKPKAPYDEIQLIPSSC